MNYFRLLIDNAVYSELPTRLTYLYSRCVLRVTLILFKDFVLTSFPSLRIPRCHVGMDDTAYTLSSSSNFGIRHQHLLVFHPTFHVRRLNFWKKLRLHVCNDQLPLSSHMNFIIQLVTNEVRIHHLVPSKFSHNYKKLKSKSSHTYWGQYPSIQWPELNSWGYLGIFNILQSRILERA